MTKSSAFPIFKINYENKQSLIYIKNTFNFRTPDGPKLYSFDTQSTYDTI